jgi:NAD(P)H-hydrate epimerase
VACVDRAALTGPAAAEAKALEAVGVAIEARPNFRGAELVVDALLGTGLTRAPEGPYAEWIRLANASGLNIVAVDVPSGLEADSGKAHDPTVRARVTVTLGLPKPGLLQGAGPAHAGDIWVADIGVPFAAYSAVGAVVPAELYRNADQVFLGGGAL